MSRAQVVLSLIVGTGIFAAAGAAAPASTVHAGHVKKLGPQSIEGFPSVQKPSGISMLAHMASRLGKPGHSISHGRHVSAAPSVKRWW